jgi:vacuolar-type H+-ATPase subunit E/Vma4
MSTEKIIEQIKKDAEKELIQIKKDAEKQAKTIIEDAKKEAKVDSEKILEAGKKQSDNIEKIIISKAHQDVKREIMNAKEKIIEECFVKAHQKLSMVKGKEYEDTVTQYIQDGIEKLGKNCSVMISREEDKRVIQKYGLTSSGHVEASGGIKLASNDGRIILDYTFDGILKRDKDKIRNKVGKLLFSK